MHNWKKIYQKSKTSNEISKNNTTNKSNWSNQQRLIKSSTSFIQTQIKTKYIQSPKLEWGIVPNALEIKNYKRDKECKLSQSYGGGGDSGGSLLRRGYMGKEAFDCLLAPSSLKIVWCWMNAPNWSWNSCSPSFNSVNLCATSC